MKILFMGTPEFAKVHLKALFDAGQKIVGAVCQSDKPTGRKKELTAPPVKICCTDNNIPIYQPDTLKNNAIEPLLKELDPELIVVVAYGKILPEYVLNYPKYGCINVHGSLLPKYRGAAPVQRAIIEGEKVTGVTIMYMDKGIDTGDIILKSECEIAEDDDGETLFKKLEPVGVEAMIQAIKLIEQGKVSRIKQNDEESTYAAMLDSTTGEIDWNNDNNAVHNLVRGTYPWPCAFSFYNGQKFKILKAVKSDKCGKPGEIIVSDCKEGLIVACRTGAVKVLNLQFEGGKKMPACDYIRGHEMKVKAILG
ncbi:MAG: methionyl-tRNA formyltransferase [Bacillota bacterium]|nr:methionyl-tRNA formyltransferase [Bacillota bacterium]